MGVYIKGMEMPTSCEKCDFHDGWCLRLPGIAQARNERREDCPLVPVPPHGDLIDKKTVSENLASVLNKKNPPFSYPDWNDAIVAMLTAPIIISASGGNEDA